MVPIGQKNRGINPNFNTHLPRKVFFQYLFVYVWIYLFVIYQCQLISSLLMVTKKTRFPRMLLRCEIVFIMIKNKLRIIVALRYIINQLIMQLFLKLYCCVICACFATLPENSLGNNCSTFLLWTQMSEQRLLSRWLIIINFRLRSSLTD